MAKLSNRLYTYLYTPIYPIKTLFYDMVSYSNYCFFCFRSCMLLNYRQLSVNNKNSFVSFFVSFVSVWPNSLIYRESSANKVCRKGGNIFK